ncbi:MAG TPA: acyl-CoA desaturase [Thermoanaerobaculia bacterium]|nr:acyl-CoA desaturase [Thermoanaerobaculia bacterium]
MAAKLRTIDVSGEPDGSVFAELKRRVQENGLLEKNPPYYVSKLVQALVLIGLAASALLLSERLWLQVLAAVLLARGCTQAGFIAHDAGHRQIFKSGRGNDMLGLMLVNALLGISYGWWVEKHNRHHANPNHLDHDPDIDFPFLAFSPEQAAAKPAHLRALIRHQAVLFIPLLSLLPYSMRADSVQFLRHTPWRYRRTEVFLLLLHGPLYAVLLGCALGPWRGLLVGAVHQAFFGIFLGSVFAINHKGMPLVGKGVRLEYVYHQVIASRNLKRHPVTDWWFGPLVCQIEHHLFPTMPRNSLRKAEPIVKSFCAQRSIPYHETGAFDSYREVLAHLHSVGARVRA